MLLGISFGYYRASALRSKNGAGKWKTWQCLQTPTTCCFFHFCTLCMSFISMDPLSTYIAINWSLWKMWFTINSFLRLTSLPIRDGGMNIPIPHPTSSQQWSLSHKICAPLVGAVLKQQQVLDPDLAQKHASNKLEAVRLQLEEKTLMKKTTVECFSLKLQWQVAIISQEGASSWLSCIHPPILPYDVVPHKQAFLDAIALRYGWCPNDMPTRCECGRPFSVDHSLNYLKGGSLP